VPASDDEDVELVVSYPLTALFPDDLLFGMRGRPMITSELFELDAGVEVDEEDEEDDELLGALLPGG
jgi:hypothetical protein